MDGIEDIKRMLYQGMEPAPGALQSIMVIDDNPEIGEALNAILRKNYKIIHCYNFADARGLLSAEIKVILLDIKMAGTDGLEAFRLIKEMRPDIRIIFHSAYPGSAEKAELAGKMDHAGYLTKGEYTTLQLRGVIDRALDGL